MRSSALVTGLLTLLILGTGMAPSEARADTGNEDVVACQPQCDGLSCGDDGCGGTCGECPPYNSCQAGACVFTGGCEPLAVAGCGSCSCEACTCALDPYCCTGKWDALCVSRCENQCGGCGTLSICGDGQCNGGETCDACPGDCGNCPPQCGPVSSKGCCAQDTLLKCVDGELTVSNCLAVEEQSCGWNLAQEEYVCGGEGVDPSGDFPLTCPTSPQTDVVEDVSLPEQCQGLGFTGCCDGNVLTWCDGLGLHQIDCAQNLPPFNVCGWNAAKAYYDCGGEGADPSGSHPSYCPDFQADVVPQDAVAPSCKVGTYVATGCDDVPWEGCCDANGALLFCEAGTLLCRLDCSGLVYPANTCGWHDGQPGYYDCGGQGVDPAGEFPYECQMPPDTPDVVTEDVAPKTCTEIPQSGCCTGNLLHWCEAGSERTFECAQLADDPVFGQYVYCGTNPVSGKADCLKKPDPSPPECGEPAVEPPIEVTPEPMPDVVEPAPEEVTQPASDTVDALAVDSLPELVGADSGGIVIPIEAIAEPPPKKGKDGCSAGPTGTPGTLLMLVALMLVILAAHGSPRSKSER